MNCNFDLLVNNVLRIFIFSYIINKQHIQTVKETIFLHYRDKIVWILLW